MRAWVRVLDRPPRWYRTLTDAAEDAEAFATDRRPGDVVAVAWEDESSDTPARVLVAKAGGALAWYGPEQLAESAGDGVAAMADGARQADDRFADRLT